MHTAIPTRRVGDRREPFGADPLLNRSVSGDLQLRCRVERTDAKVPAHEGGRAAFGILENKKGIATSIVHEIRVRREDGESSLKRLHDSVDGQASSRIGSPDAHVPARLYEEASVGDV